MSIPPANNHKHAILTPTLQNEESGRHHSPIKTQHRRTKITCLDLTQFSNNIGTEASAGTGTSSSSRLSEKYVLSQLSPRGKSQETGESRLSRTFSGLSGSHEFETINFLTQDFSNLSLTTTTSSPRKTERKTQDTKPQKALHFFENDMLFLFNLLTESLNRHRKYSVETTLESQQKKSSSKIIGMFSKLFQEENKKPSVSKAQLPAAILRDTNLAGPFSKAVDKLNDPYQLHIEGEEGLVEELVKLSTPSLNKIYFLLIRYSKMQKEIGEDIATIVGYILLATEKALHARIQKEPSVDRMHLLESLSNLENLVKNKELFDVFLQYSSHKLYEPENSFFLHEYQELQLLKQELDRVQKGILIHSSSNYFSELEEKYTSLRLSPRERSNSQTTLSSSPKSTLREQFVESSNVFRLQSRQKKIHECIAQKISLLLDLLPTLNTTSSSMKRPVEQSQIEPFLEKVFLEALHNIAPHFNLGPLMGLSPEVDKVFIFSDAVCSWFSQKELPMMTLQEVKEFSLKKMI